MQIAILLYDRFTVLDAIGPYQVLSGIPDAEVVFVAEHPGPIRDQVGSLVLSAASRGSHPLSTSTCMPEPAMWKGIST